MTGAGWGVLVLAVLAVGFGVPLLVSIRRTGRRAAQDLIRAAATRPDWRADPKALGLPARYRRTAPFDARGQLFRSLLTGPTPSGALAEVFHFVATRPGESTTVSTGWTVVTLVHDHPLPAAWLRNAVSARAAGPAPSPDRGPEWAGLQGEADDPRAAEALFTPARLRAARRLRLDWRTDGHAAIGLVPRLLPPAEMLALADRFDALLTDLPTPVLTAAATHPTPWPGPTPTTPA